MQRGRVGKGTNSYIRSGWKNCKGKENGEHGGQGERKGEHDPKSEKNKKQKGEGKLTYDPRANKSQV